MSYKGVSPNECADLEVLERKQKIFVGMTWKQALVRATVTPLREQSFKNGNSSLLFPLLSSPSFPPSSLGGDRDHQVF